MFQRVMHCILLSLSLSFAGIINLENCSKVTNRENMRGYKHVFDVCTSERKYHLVADSEVEKHDWIDTLNTTLFAGPSQAQSAVAPHNPSHDPSTNSRQQPTQHHQVRDAAIRKHASMFIILVIFQFKYLPLQHLSIYKT